MLLTILEVSPVTPVILHVHALNKFNLICHSPSMYPSYTLLWVSAQEWRSRYPPSLTDASNGHQQPSPPALNGQAQKKFL